MHLQTVILLLKVVMMAASRKGAPSRTASSIFASFQGKNKIGGVYDLISCGQTAIFDDKLSLLVIQFEPDKRNFFQNENQVRQNSTPVMVACGNIMNVFSLVVALQLVQYEVYSVPVGHI